MLKSVFAGLLVSLACATASAEPIAWNLDENHSDISFTVKHLGFTKVRGEFKKFAGKVTADAKTAKITELQADIDARSIDTGVEKRDNHLRQDDFFGTEKYPAIKLVLKSINWQGKAFTATGALTIRDVTKDVKFQGTLEGPKAVNFGQGSHLRAGYHATAKINRKDFNLKFAAVTEGIAVVADEVEIDINAEISAPVAGVTAVPAKDAKDKATPATAPATAPAPKP